jgi:Phospholipase_D-nuclease N-terminal
MEMIAALYNVAGPDLIVLFPIVLLGLFKIWMIVDCVTNEKGNDLLVWILIVIFVPFGGLIYFFVRKRARGKGAG